MLSAFSAVVMFLVISVAGAALTWWLRQFALHHGAVAHPNERSSHTIPTPHNGGVAVALMSCISVSIALLLGWWPVPVALVCVTLGLFMLSLGVRDDLRGVAPSIRLTCHFLVVCISLLVIWREVGGSYSDYGVAWTVLLGALCLILWVWFINLFNFMDGIDGLAATQALLLFAFMGGNFWFLHYMEWAVVCLFLVGSVIGFWFFNWPPARIFMGDGGSGFLGFLIGFIAMLSVSMTDISIWSWLILVALFLADATATLLVRFFRGENIVQAHRSHAYQVLAQRLGAHLPVTLAYGLVMLLVLAPLSWFVTVRPWLGAVVFFAVFTTLMLLMYCLGCGRQRAEGLQ